MSHYSYELVGVVARVASGYSRDLIELAVGTGSVASIGTQITLVGSSGVTGPQGPQGPPGPSGVTGPQGPSGVTGPQGPSGVTGEQGLQGIPGIPGTTTWAGITDKPTTFAPSAHTHDYAASSHTHDYAASGHTHLYSALVNIPATFAPAAHSVVGSEHTFPGGTTFLRADGVFAAPSGGADPWTVRAVSADTGRANVAFGDISDLSFTPVANTRYMFEAYLMLRTGAATNNPRPGVAWPTGLSDGVAMIDFAQTAVARLLGNGNIASPVSTAAAGGIPDATNSWPAFLSGVVVAGAAPSGRVSIQYAAELATSRVTVRAGSYLRYRTF